MPDKTQAGTEVANPIATWNAMQHRLWRNWADMAGSVNKWPINDFYKDSLTILEDATDRAIDTQAEWNRLCLKNLHPADASLPPAWEDSCQRLEAFADEWASSVRSAANSWFDAVGHQRPINWSESVELALTLCNNWNDLRRQLFASERAWMVHMLQGGELEEQAASKEAQAANDTPTKGDTANKQRRNQAA